MAVSLRQFTQMQRILVTSSNPVLYFYFRYFRGSITSFVQEVLERILLHTCLSATPSTHSRRNMLPSSSRSSCHEYWSWCFNGGN